MTPQDRINEFEEKIAYCVNFRYDQERSTLKTSFDRPILFNN